MSFDIAKARALCAAGPWDDPLPECDCDVCAVRAYAAAARTGWPEALDEIERLRKALADRAIMLPRCPDCGAYVGPQQP